MQQSVFHYNEPSGIRGLDPAFAREQSDIWAMNQLFNGLVELDAALHVKPALAKSWTIDSSGTLYSFILRSDVYFHKDDCFGADSTRTVIASDVVYSLNRITDAATASPGAWVLSEVKTIEAVGDSIVNIQLKRAFPSFLGMLSMKYCSIVAPEAVAKYGTEFSRHPIGTGPFYLKRWMENEKLVLRRNPFYFESDGEQRLPYLEAVAITFITDRQASFLEFLKGKNDLLWGLDASYKDEMITVDGALQSQYEERFTMQKGPYLNTEYLAILQNLPDNHPLHDLRVRRALNMGFDRAEMMKYLRNGIGKPADGGMIPKGLPGYHPKVTGGFAFNPAEAARLLEEAGYPKGVGMQPVVISTTSNYRDLCEYIQSSWRKLGVPTEVEVLPSASLREAKAQGGLPMFRASWIADYPDAENYLALFYSPNFTPNGPNYTFYKNETFDRWYVKSLTITDEESRANLYSRMDSLINDDAPIVPLYYDEVVRFIPKHIEGMEINPVNLLDLRRVKKHGGTNP